MSHTQIDKSAIMRARDDIYKLPPKYPSIGHQYLCGYNDARADAAAILDQIITVAPSDQTPVIPVRMIVTHAMKIAGMEAAKLHIELDYQGRATGRRTSPSTDECEEIFNAMLAVSPPAAGETDSGIDLGWQSAKMGMGDQDDGEAGKRVDVESLTQEIAQFFYPKPPCIREVLDHLASRGYLSSAPVVPTGRLSVDAKTGAQVLRWLLNDIPNMFLTTALDQHKQKDGRTNRQMLELLYSEINAPPPPAREQGDE